MSTYEWIQDFPADDPTTIASLNVGLICNDTNRDRVILWGYTDEASFPNASPTARLTTWEYYSGNWHGVTTVNAPTLIGTTPFGFCYDQARGEVVLAVKSGVGAIQTWTYNGTNWTQKSPAHNPTIIVTGANLTYDVANGVSVLFGSNAGSVMETWTWDGTDWTQIVSATLMTPWRYDFGFAYYDAGGYILQHGGSTGSSTLTETWKLDVGANTWTQLTPATTPAGGQPRMAYDATIGQIVMYNSTDTYLWDGTDWSNPTPSPDIPDRSWTPIAFDTEVGKTMMYGVGDATHLFETWFFSGFDIPPPNVAAFQRIYGWRANIDDNALETVEVLVSLETDTL